MLSLAPLSGLQAAIKRRHSKASRRDSLSIEHSNLALPGTIRRFSSSEALNAQTPAAAPSVATVSRKSSFSRRIRKISSGSNPGQAEVVDTCCVLDLHIAQIKRKLVSYNSAGGWVGREACGRVLWAGEWMARQAGRHAGG